MKAPPFNPETAGETRRAVEKTFAPAEVVCCA